MTCLLMRFSIYLRRVARQIDNASIELNHTKVKIVSCLKLVDILSCQLHEVLRIKMQYFCMLIAKDFVYKIEAKIELG